MRIAVTGRPGVGKTTLCLKVYERLKDRAAGFVTVEVRESGKRVGFRLRSLKSGREVWLAKVGAGSVKVGKYAVFVDNLESFLDEEDFEAEILIVDEVGPMELKSRKFVRFAESLFDREKVLVTVHYKSRHPLPERIRREFKLFVLNEENRDRVADEVAKLLDRG
ncbi:MAG: NTPase [Archaeoglobaceae archaeon]